MPETAPKSVAEAPEGASAAAAALDLPVGAARRPGFPYAGTAAQRRRRRLHLLHVVPVGRLHERPQPRGDLGARDRRPRSSARRRRADLALSGVVRPDRGVHVRDDRPPVVRPDADRPGRQRHRRRARGVPRLAGPARARLLPGDRDDGGEPARRPPRHHRVVDPGRQRRPHRRADAVVPRHRDRRRDELPLLLGDPAVDRDLHPPPALRPRSPAPRDPGAAPRRGPARRLRRPLVAAEARGVHRRGRARRLRGRPVRRRLRLRVDPGLRPAGVVRARARRVHRRPGAAARRRPRRVRLPGELHSSSATASRSTASPCSARSSSSPSTSSRAG